MCRMEGNDWQKFWRKYANESGRDMDKNIYDILIENATNEYMDNILLHDTEYKEIQDKISELTEQIDKFELSKEQRLIMDRLISAYTASGCCYGRIAYQSGIRDCALLLREMGLIK